jgi:hypothetical protein
MNAGERHVVSDVEADLIKGGTARPYFYENGAGAEDAAADEVVEMVLTHFQDALEYVLSVGIPSSDLTNLVAQFRSQAVVTSRF